MPILGRLRGSGELVAMPHTQSAAGLLGSRAWGRSVGECCLAAAGMLVLIGVAVAHADAPAAFPGAEGFGANAQGGRGGDVHEVSNLADSGPGSLRACIEAAGARTCTFRVGGTIDLATALVVRSPYLTIAGQTAPGGGIQLRLDQDVATARTPLIISDTHDVIVRHLRSRPGANPNAAARPGTDAITIVSSERVILDHVSTAWAPDENINLHLANRNITIQWSIMAEGLLDHSKGLLVCSRGFGCGNITIHHNLIVSNGDRNPQASHDGSAGIYEFYNNVVHNPNSEFMEVWGHSGGGRINVIGNTFRRGPSTRAEISAIEFHRLGMVAEPLIHAEDNTLGLDVSLWGSAVLPRFRSSDVVGEPSMRPEPAALAYTDVLAGAGAFPRDAVDTRLIGDVVAGAGRMIASQDEVGGWPSLGAGLAPPDSDRDGMPDWWEASRGLSSSDPADRNGDSDGDGYTNLEDYLNERAGLLVAQRRPARGLKWSAGTPLPGSTVSRMAMPRAPTGSGPASPRRPGGRELFSSSSSGC